METTIEKNTVVEVKSNETGSQIMVGGFCICWLIAMACAFIYGMDNGIENAWDKDLTLAQYLPLLWDYTKFPLIIIAIGGLISALYSNRKDNKEIIIAAIVFFAGLHLVPLFTYFMGLILPAGHEVTYASFITTGGCIGSMWATFCLSLLCVIIPHFLFYSLRVARDFFRS